VRPLNSHFERGRSDVARVISHDVLTIRFELHDFNLGLYRRSRLYDCSPLLSDRF